jgi:hypothetical protein
LSGRTIGAEDIERTTGEIRSGQTFLQKKPWEKELGFEKMAFLILIRKGRSSFIIFER